MEIDKHELRHCSQTCCMGSFCSSCIASRFLFRLSNDRIQFLFAEHNPNGIANNWYFASDWMENLKKSSKIVT